MSLFSTIKKAFGVEEKDESKQEVSNIVSNNGSESKQRVFDIESVIGSLEKKFDENFQLFKEEIKKSYDEIQARLNDLKGSLINLEKAKLGGDLDAETLRLNSALINLTNAHRKSFIEKMNIMINQLNKSLGSDVDSILEYQQFALHSIIIADGKTLKDYGFFKDMLKKESKEITEKFQLLYDAMRNFDYSVHEKIGNVFSIKKAQDEAASIKKDMEIIQKNKGTLETIARELVELHIKRKSLEENLKKLESDENYLSFMERGNAIESEISKMKSEIYRNFSLIDKPLRRFRYLIQKNVEKIEIDDEKILNRFLDSPVDTLIETGDFALVNSFLDKLQADILNGKLDIKNKEKILQNIKAMIEHNIFKELVLRYNSLEDELNKLKKDKEMENVLKSKNEVRGELEQINRDIEMKSKEIERRKKFIEKLDVSIKERTDDLKKMLPSFLEGKALEVEVLQCDWCRKVIDEPSHIEVFSDTKYGFCSEKCKENFMSWINKMRVCGPSCACH